MSRQGVHGVCLSWGWVARSPQPSAHLFVLPSLRSQTQVSRAAEYFRRWVARWPTVQALAAASQEEVNELWAGEAAAVAVLVSNWAVAAASQEEVNELWEGEAAAAVVVK